jgi:hypothetical protein
VIREDRRSVGRRQALCVEDVLDGETYPGTLLVRTGEKDSVEDRRHAAMLVL